MPVKETVVACVRERGRLEEFLRNTFYTSLNFNSIGLDKIFCIRKGGKIQVFLAPSLIKEEVIVERLDKIGFIGVLAGELYKDILIPSIHLAYVVTTYFLPKLKKGVIRLGQDRARRFIYSKPVKIGLINDDYRNKTRMYLVVSIHNDPLGWGKEEKGVLYPIVDSGWFFRQGG